MTFVADVMLGRLARLMRFKGYDVEYDRTAEDDALVRRSRYRVLLTKDRALAKRISQPRVYLVDSVGGENQLAEIEKRFPLPKGQTGSRCLMCNRKLRRIKKERVRHLVPPFVYIKHHTFHRCGSCKRIYWPGTHFEHMSRMIE